MANKTNTLTAELLTELFINQNKTIAQIALEYSCGTATVSRLLKKYNITKSKELRNEAISQTKQNKTEEEKQEYSNAISKARKGKGIGIEPWNKGKTGVQAAWNKGMKMSDEFKAAVKFGLANMSDEDKQVQRERQLVYLKGREPWNKGLHYTLDPETIKLAKAKENESKKLNGTYGKSSIEDDFNNRLLGYFLEADFERQYYDNERYPFSCDFYVRPLDLFIELNINWTHGFKPYDSTDPACTKQLTYWTKKAETSEYYKNAIYTWTDLDVRKQTTAAINNLNYIALYTKDDVEKFFMLLGEE